ncbi:CdaR family protein [Paenibacillus sp. P96]|uniref:CdaR family protein n=1 Tax=Paenibacillus zeirhizosphaerae TaxID=2987519 RepID=A0ABT9FT89_9BACL|nr:CdaR family protein [Paenibacillus sp. P96]MDP4097948.1 CdaR family protein [Paenibacillus sp. P96]
MMDRWFNNATFSKLLALLISILLWAMVHLDSGTTSSGITTAYDNKTIKDVAVQAAGLNDNYVLTGMSTDRVTLEVRGKRSLLTSFFTDDYKVTVDLTNMKSGTETLPLRTDLPSGVEVVSINPSMVTVTVEEKKTEAFNVNIATNGDPAAGMRLGTPTSDPAEVHVTLAESRLEAVASVRGTVDVSGAKENVTERKVRLRAYDKNGQEIEEAVIEPATVSIEVPVVQGYKTLPIRVSYTGDLPDGLVLASVKPSVTEASVYAPSAVLSELTGNVTATLNLSTLTEAGTRQVQANLTVPEGAGSVYPAAIELEVTVAPDGAVTTSQRTIENVPIQINGAAEAGGVTIVTPESQTLSVSVNGPEDLVSELTNDDIALVADVAGLEPGQHNVSLQVTLPKYISLTEEDTPLSATVQVQDSSEPTVTTPEGDTGESSTGESGESNGGEVQETLPPDGAGEGNATEGGQDTGQQGSEGSPNNTEETNQP